MKTNRRDFVKKALITGICTCMGVTTFNNCSMVKGISETPILPIEAYQLKNKQLLVSLKQEDVLPIGEAVKLKISTKDSENDLKLIIVHIDKSKYKVFEDSCTHGGKELNYNHTERNLQCSSFGHSVFKLDGAVIKGPAKKTLKQFNTKIEQDSLIIDLTYNPSQPPHKRKD